MRYYIVYIFLIITIFAADSHWMLQFILPHLLLTVPLFFIGLGTHIRNVDDNRDVTIPFFVFITYILVVKLLREDNYGASCYTYLITILTIFASLYLKRTPKYLYHFICLTVLLNLGFQIIQVFGVNVNGGKLLAPLGFKEYAEVDLFDTTRGFRFSGLYTSVVPLGFISGASTAYFWILYTKVRRKKYLILAVCGLAMSILTNTRAVMYFIIPSILLTNFIVWKRLPAKIVALCVLFIFFVSIGQSLSGFDSEKSSMNASNWEKDGGVVDRIQGNVYGTVGTMMINPIFGLSQEDQAEAIREGYNQVGLFIGTRFVNHVTFHNLPLYYLRIYGIIGFVLFCWFYVSCFKYANKQKDPYTRQYMLTALVFFFLYNLTHNMKVDYLIFWMMIFASYKLPINSLNQNRIE